MFEVFGRDPVFKLADRRFRQFELLRNFGNALTDKQCRYDRRAEVVCELFSLLSHSGKIKQREDLFRKHESPGRFPDRGFSLTIK
jgi:hypothetical protein